MQKSERNNGHDTAIKRNIRVVDGDTHNLGNYERNNQLHRLHFAYLPFAHKPNAQKNYYENYHRFDKNYQHIFSINKTAHF